jgi:hypothetical protein
MPIKAHQVIDADFLTKNDLSGNASDVVGGDGIVRPATFEFLETLDFVDPLNNSVLHPNWTEAGDGTKTEDSEKLELSDTSTDDWGVNAPRVYLLPQHYDFAVKVHVSNKTVQNWTEVVLAYYDFSNINTKMRFGLRSNSGAWQLLWNISSDNTIVADIGQDNCWLAIRRRGGDLILYYSIGSYTDEPNIDLMTYATTQSVSVPYGNAAIALVHVGWTYNGAWSCEFRKFSLKYETVSTRLRGYVGQGIDFHDNLNNSDIHDNWTKDIVDVADPDPTIIEDDTKLAIGRSSGGLTLDWYGSTFTAPNLKLSIEPLDFVAKVFVSNVVNSANSNAGGIVHYLDGSKTDYGRNQLSYHSGTYRIHSVVDDGEQHHTSVIPTDQDYAWLAIMRRGNRIYYLASANDVDNEPSLDDMTIVREFDQEFSYNKNIIALLIVVWGSQPATDTHFQKFSLVYNNINLYENATHLVEQHFTTDGTETPDANVYFNLNKTPGGAGLADTLSGYHLLFYRNGQKLDYVGVFSGSSAEQQLQYKYNPSSNIVTIKASGDEEGFDAVLLEGAQITPQTTTKRDSYLFSSAVDAAVVDTSGRFTQGNKFRCNKACNIVGVRYYVGGTYTGSLTNKLSLWRVDGQSQLKTKSVDAPTTAGFYEVLFDSPFEISGSDIGEEFMATIYWGEAKHWQASSPTLTQGPRSIGDAYNIDARPSFYTASDAFPTSNWSGGHYFIDPIIEYEDDVVIETTAIYAGHEEDIPPSSPSSYDDEFTGSGQLALDSDWSWIRRGNPDPTYGTWGIDDGRLWLNINGNGSGWDITKHHTLAKMSPDSVDFEVYIKLRATVWSNYHMVGIFMDNGVDSGGSCNWVGWMRAKDGGGQVLKHDRVINGSFTGDQAERVWYDNLVFLKIKYTHSTQLYEFLCSPDGTVWDKSGEFDSVFTPSRIGIYLFDEGSSGFAASFSWFRVKLL